MVEQCKRIKLLRIKLLIMDVDGTLTDGKMYFTSSGDEIKAFNAKDGCGIAVILPQLGIIPAIITGRMSDCVVLRSKQLGITDVFQNSAKKLKQLEELREKYNLQYDEIAVVGDDLNDLEIFSVCGFTACPADACDEIKEKSDLILSKAGGNGAVRELIEFIKDRRDNEL